MPPKTFFKMHGLGNDFIIVYPEFFSLENRCFAPLETFTAEERQLISKESIRLCHRAFGIGADGVILITKGSHFKMNVINSDGTWARMCGNGLRNVSHILHLQHKLGASFEVDTDSGRRSVEVKGEEDLNVAHVKVDMGVGGSVIPITLFCDSKKSQLIQTYFQGATAFYSVFGNQQIIIFLEDIFAANLFQIKDLQILAEWVWKTSQPRGNVNFCVCLSASEIKVITYEMGAGLTYACGTGTCACAYVGYKNKLLNSEVKAITKGGIMNVSISTFGQALQISMLGPSTFVYEGKL